MQVPPTALGRANTTPRVYVADDFASPEERSRLLALPPEALGIDDAREDEAGLSFELPLDADPTAADVAARIEAAIGITNQVGGTLRWRRYMPGQSHPVHNDSYEIGHSTLIVTALLYLTTPDEGGGTWFPSASPSPLLVRARAGRLLVWFNHTPDGAVDPLAVHEGLPVLRGQKTTVTNFLYAPLTASATEPPAVTEMSA